MTIEFNQIGYSLLINSCEALKVITEEFIENNCQSCFCKNPLGGWKIKSVPLLTFLFPLYMDVLSCQLQMLGCQSLFRRSH